MRQPQPTRFPDPADAGRDRIVRAIPLAYVGTLLVVSLVEVAIMLVIDRVWPGASREQRAMLDGLLLLLITLPALWIVVVGPYRRLAVAELDRSLASQRQVLAVARRQDFVARLQGALDGVDDEKAAIATTGQALSEVRGVVSAELRLSGSAFAPFSEGAACGHGPRCGVPDPPSCPAIRAERTLVFTTSAASDACPFLRGPGQPHTSASCIPVLVDHQPVGLLRALGPEHDPPDAGALIYLEASAAALGNHLRLLRALVSFERRANTDPLTGLLNRRSLEARLRENLAEPGPVCVCQGDIDHFKHLNDTFGHEMGDRALRMLAHVLRSVLRPGDLMARTGGEEFVVVLPGCRMEEATQVLERVRTVLRIRTADGTRVPPFTLSWGAVQAGPGASTEDLLRAADAAMYRAKRAGRDRVVVADEPSRPT